MRTYGGLEISLEEMEEERSRFTGYLRVCFGFQINRTYHWIAFGNKVDSSVYIYRELEV